MGENFIQSQTNISCCCCYHDDDITNSCAACGDRIPVSKYSGKVIANATAPSPPLCYIGFDFYEQQYSYRLYILGCWCFLLQFYLESSNNLDMEAMTLVQQYDRQIGDNTYIGVKQEGEPLKIIMARKGGEFEESIMH
jgi:hypothetical protein